MFYTFGQNNSGGSFHNDRTLGIGSYVIVEADDFEHANERAREIGLYFDGVDSGDDCECCGDRWYPKWEGDKGTPTPMIYGDEVHGRGISEEMELDWICNDGNPSYIHFLDGRILPIAKYKTKR